GITQGRSLRPCGLRRRDQERANQGRERAPGRGRRLVAMGRIFVGRARQKAGCNHRLYDTRLIGERYREEVRLCSLVGFETSLRWLRLWAYRAGGWWLLTSDPARLSAI